MQKNRVILNFKEKLSLPDMFFPRFIMKVEQQYAWMFAKSFVTQIGNG